MNPLSIDNAIRLYLLLKDHIPSVDKELGMDVMEFTGKIVDSIIEKHDPKALTLSIALMLNADEDEIIRDLTPNERITCFMEGLMINRILDLQEFCRQMRF